MSRLTPPSRRPPAPSPPARPQHRHRPDGDWPVIAWMLLAVGACLLISAAIYFFDDFANSLLATPGAWFKGYAPNLLLGLIGAIVIILFNLLAIPAALLTRWVALGLGLLCCAAAAGLYWRLRRNRRRRLQQTAVPKL